MHGLIMNNPEISVDYSCKISSYLISYMGNQSIRYLWNIHGVYIDLWIVHGWSMDALDAPETERGRGEIILFLMLVNILWWSVGGSRATWGSSSINQRQLTRFKSMHFGNFGSHRESVWSVLKIFGDLCDVTRWGSGGSRVIVEATFKNSFLWIAMHHA